jgi:hypothetical protein
MLKHSTREIIVAVQVGAVKIYVAAAEPLRKKERQGQTQKPSKLYQKKRTCGSSLI